MQGSPVSRNTPRRFPVRLNATKRNGPFVGPRPLMTALLIIGGWMLGVWMLGSGAFGQQEASAQSPPSLPENRPDVLSDGGLHPTAFYLLDEDGNRVVYPSLTFEEVDRLMKLDENLVQPTRSYSYDSVAIDAVATDDRAVLTVTVRLQVDPSSQGWSAIPLRMGNFHRVAPADVSGVEHYRMDQDPQHDGYLLWVRTQRPQQVEVQMRAVTRVDGASSEQIQFHLPDAPTTISLKTRGEQLTARVIGRGDEIVRQGESEGDLTTFLVDSGGGDFVLAWGETDSSGTNRQVLECEGRWDIQWSSAQERPTASVALTVRNLRGDLQPFEIEVPAGVRIIETFDQTDEVGGGEPIELLDASEPPLTPGAQRKRVIPDRSSTGAQMDLKLLVELGPELISEETPLRLRGVQVIGAVSQGGEVIVRSQRDYRLRWQRQPWIRSEWSRDPASTENGRRYRFVYDRVPFELPMWLAAKQRQLRVQPEMEIRIGKTTADLQLNLQASGAAPDGRLLRIDVAGWQLQSVESPETGEPLEPFVEGSVREIDLSAAASAATEAVSVRIKAVRPIAADDDRIELPLPRVLNEDDTMLVQPGQLTVITEAGISLVTDVSESIGVTERPPTAGATGPPTTHYQVGPEATLVGYLIEDRPQVAVQASATVTIEDDDRLVTQVDWTLRPQGALAGRLPLAFPTDQPLENWVVTVDQQPAVLRALDDGRAMLIAPQLQSGEHQVRFHNSRLLEPPGDPPQTQVLELGLPSPGIGDVSMGAAVRIEFRGSPTWDLAVDVDGTPNTELVLERLPTRPLKLRLQARQETRNRVVVPRAMLRSICGRKTRQERLVATVVGTGVLQLQLQLPAGNPEVRTRVDGAELDLTPSSDGTLQIPLTSTATEHVVDVRVWVNVDGSAVGSRLQPVIRLPVGTGQLFWMIVLPSDEHIVWASPTLGRAMRWQFDRWQLRRVATQSEQSLAQWAGGTTAQSTTIGNEYLYIGADPWGLQVVTAGKSLIWAVVGGLVLIVATGIVYLPWLRHPLSVVVAAVALGGVTLLAPDAAVLAGQLTLLALSLVAVMMGVRAALLGRPHERVFTGTPASREGSTRTTSQPSSPTADPASTGSATVAVPARVGEVP